MNKLLVLLGLIALNAHLCPAEDIDATPIEIIQACVELGKLEPCQVPVCRAAYQEVDNEFQKCCLELRSNVDILNNCLSCDRLWQALNSTDVNRTAVGGTCNHSHRGCQKLQFVGEKCKNKK